MSKPLPPELVPPSGIRCYNDQYYAKVQAEYYAKQQAECYTRLLAEQQALPPATQPPLTLPDEKVASPSYKQQFISLVENKLGEYEQLNYVAAMQKIDAFFPKKEAALPSFPIEKPPAPFREVPLLGYADQSTIHFHCGIRNTFASIVEGGLALSTSLDKEFAIQPHLIHSDNILTGLTFVGLEKLDATAAGLWDGLFGVFPRIALEASQIQRSIEYEVANLSTIAQNIIQTNNPNLKQVHVTFSNGGYVLKEALKQLPPEYRQTIVVITAGTTAIIENHLACEVYNVVGDKDWPSMRCNGGLSGIEKAKANATVKVIPQSETQPGIGGHYFMQDDYQDKISDFIKNEINGKYEIY